MRHARLFFTRCLLSASPFVGACLAPGAEDLPIEASNPELAASEQALGSDDREAGLNDVIYNTLDITEDPNEINTINSWSSLEYRNTGTFKCTYREVDEVRNTAEIVAYDPNAGILYPGSLVQGDSIEGGILEPINLPRSGGRVTVVGPTIIGTPSFRDFAQYNHGNVTTAINDIFQSATSVNTSSVTDIEVHDVRKLESKLLELGVSAEWAKNRLNLAVTASESHVHTDLFILFRQRYFTAAVDNWVGPNKALAFANTVQPEEAALVMSPRNPPAYVRNVTYGRMLIMRLTTDVDESTLRAALSAAFTKSGGTFGANLSLQHQQTLNQTRFYAAALGGNPVDSNMIMSEGPTRLKDYLNAGAQFSPSNPGHPLSYTVAHFATDSVIKLANASRYLVPECQLASDKIRVTLERIDVHSDGDNIGAGDFRYGFGVSQSASSGELGMMAGEHKRNDGQPITIGISQDISLDQRNENCFNVQIKVNEYDDRFDHTKESMFPSPDLTFCYSAGRNIWELNRSLHKQGDTYLLPLRGGRVSVTARFNLARVSDCPQGMLSDGTMCMVPSAYTINKNPGNDITACYGNPIVVDARNLYATSSHLRRSNDSFFIEVFQTDAAMGPWYWGAQQWVRMGSEPAYMLENRFDVAQFFAANGNTIQPGSYYSVKLASNPWNETRKRLYVKSTAPSFTINESSAWTMSVDYDEPIVLDGSQSCTIQGVYTLGIAGPGVNLSRTLTAQEAARIGSLDVRKFAATYGANLVPGNSYTVRLAVSNGVAHQRAISIQACPPNTKWNGQECISYINSSLWDVDNNDCYVRTGAGTVAIADCTDQAANLEVLSFGDNVVRLQFLGSAECLAAPDLLHSPATTRACDSNAKVLFEVVQLGNGVVRLTNKQTQQCLSFPTSGAPMMTNCTNSEPVRVAFDWAHESE